MSALTRFSTSGNLVPSLWHVVNALKLGAIHRCKSIIQLTDKSRVQALIYPGGDVSKSVRIHDNKSKISARPC
jgi:hypothetical protein